MLVTATSGRTAELDPGVTAAELIQLCRDLGREFNTTVDAYSRARQAVIASRDGVTRTESEVAFFEAQMVWINAYAASWPTAR